MIQVHSPVRVLTIIAGLAAILSSAVVALDALFLAACGLAHNAARVIDLATSPTMVSAGSIAFFVVLLTAFSRHQGQTNRYPALLIKAL